MDTAGMSTRPARGPHEARVTYLRTGMAAIPLLAFITGALAARPLGDDYGLEAALSAHGAAGAFGWYMTHWSAYFSTYGMLTAVAATLRAVHADRYLETVMAVALIGLLWSAARQVVGWVLPDRADVPVLVAVSVLGSFVSFASDHDPSLYSAAFWAPAWVSHLAPMFLAPFIFGLMLRRGPRRRRDVVALFVSSGFAGGFGIVETVILVAVAIAAAVVARRLGAPADVKKVCAVVGGLVVAAAVVWLLPGTGQRQAFYLAHHMGTADVHGPGAVLARLWALSKADAWAVIASPAPVLGFALGWIVRRQRGGHAGDGESRAVPAVAAAGVGVTMAACVATAIGDVGSYRAGWHLYPLWISLYGTCGVAGWAAAMSRAVHCSARRAVVVTVVCLGWCTLALGGVAATAWSRRGTFDRNLASAAHARNPSAPIVWTSVDVGPMLRPPIGDDADWRTDISRWLGVPVSSLHVVRPRSSG